MHTHTHTHLSNGLTFSAVYVVQKIDGILHNTVTHIAIVPAHTHTHTHTHINTHTNIEWTYTHPPV